MSRLGWSLGVEGEGADTPPGLAQETGGVEPVVISHEAIVAYEQALTQAVAAHQETIAQARAHTPLAIHIREISAQAGAPVVTTPALAHRRGWVGHLLDLAPDAITDHLPEGFVLSRAVVTVSKDRPGDDHHVRDGLGGFCLDLAAYPLPKTLAPTIRALVGAGYVVVRGDVIVDPWQIWEAKALGMTDVILTVGAQVTPDLTNLIRVCEEVGIGWILRVAHTLEIREGLAAIDDAFAKQAPVYCVHSPFHPVTPEWLAGVMSTMALDETVGWMVYQGTPNPDEHRDTEPPQGEPQALCGGDGGGVHADQGLPPWAMIGLLGWITPAPHCPSCG